MKYSASARFIGGHPLSSHDSRYDANHTEGRDRQEIPHSSKQQLRQGVECASPPFLQLQCISDLSDLHKSLEEEYGTE